MLIPKAPQRYDAQDQTELRRTVDILVKRTAAQDQLNAAAAKAAANAAATAQGAADTANSTVNGVKAKTDIALDAAGNLVSEVAAGAKIGDALAGYVGKAQHGIFLETFETLPTAWTEYAPGNASAQTMDGQAGGKAAQFTAPTWRVFPYNIAFDPSKLYRIRVRVKQTATGGAAPVMYCGVEGIAADGVTLVNTAGSNSNASQHYVCAQNVSVPVDGAWHDYTGFFKGWSASGSGVPGSGTAPAALHSSVRYFRPLFVLNNNGNGASVAEIDYLAIDVLDEDAITRAYTALSHSGELQTNVAAGATVNGIAAPTVATGGSRAATALNSSNRLVTGVDSGATIAGLSASVVGRAQGAGVFTETFESGVGEWQVSNGPGSLSSGALGTGPVAYGQFCMELTGETWAEYKRNIPFDPSKLYRMRVAYTVLSFGGGSALPAYAGLCCYGADGVTRINTLGANTIGSSHYLVLAGSAIGYNSQVFQVYEGWFQGNGSPFYAPTSATNPTPLAAGVHYFRPMVIGNYGGAGGAMCAIGYVEITEYDNDGTKRTYRALGATGRLNSARTQKTVTLGSSPSYVCPPGTTTPFSPLSCAASQLTVTVANFDVVLPGGAAVSYTGNAVYTGTYEVPWYVYCDDPNLAGGAVTYHATRNIGDLAASEDRVFVGQITPHASTSSTGTGGGAGKPPV